MKNNSLQILRAFAAISVLITHVFQKSGYKPFGNYFLSGQYGVDIFFILSGFLIYITTKNQTNHWVYLKKRIFRIYPLYLFALIFYITFKVNYENLNIEITNLIQNILMLPWDAKFSYKSLIVGVAWSTLFEMFFYSLFFFLIFFKLKRHYILFLIPMLLLIFIPISKLNLIKEGTPFISLFISLAASYHLIMFFTGCAIAELLISNKIPKIGRSIYLGLLFSSIILILISFTVKYNVVLSFIACTFLFITTLQYEQYFTLNTKNPILSKIIYLGDISYSIYIFHVLIIGVLLSVFGVTNIPLLLLLTLFFTIFISNYTYKYIEKRFIELGKK